MEADHLAGESVHPARDPGVASQHLRLYTVQIVLEPFAHRIVAFDDPVHDLVKDHMRSSLEPIGLAFHLLAEYAQGRICAVQDYDDEVRCHKGMYLPELDPLRALNVTRRPEHYKEALAVRLDRFLHCQLVQPELPSDGSTSSMLGSRRLIQANLPGSRQARQASSGVPVVVRRPST